MATITITRDTGYSDATRAYTVLLDGSAVGKLAAGESATYPVAAGRHRLSVKIDWCGSKELSFQVGPEDQASFAVASSLRGLRVFLAIWYSFFERDGYLVLTQAQ